jgi:predicted metal-binding membrane protein
MIADARERARVRTPMLLITAAAWALLLIGPGSSLMLTHHHAAPAEHSAHAAHVGAMPLAASWMLMLVAMMTPALIPPILHLRLRSFTQRRARTVTLFVAAYAAIWLAAGAVLIAIALMVPLLALQAYPISGAATAAAAAVLALIWQCSPMKQRCLNRCHAHREIAAFGAAADIDALRFGVTHGMWCTGACWPLMLFPLLLPTGHMIAMALVTLVIVSERLERSRPPRWQVRLPAKAIRIAIAQTRIRLKFASLSN